MFCECRPYIVIFDLECEDFFYTTRNELDLTTEYPVGEASDEDTADYIGASAGVAVYLSGSGTNTGEAAGDKIVTATLELRGEPCGS